MQVTFAVLADYANISKEGKPNIMGIFENISARDFPYIHSQMFLVMRFEADLAETGQTKTLEIHLMDEDGKKIFVLPGKINIRGVEPGKVMSWNQMIRLERLEFKNPGDYVFNILVNGEPRGRVPLKVTKIAPSGDPSQLT